MNSWRTDYVLEPFDLPELILEGHSPRDLYDRFGQLLLAKGQPVTPFVKALLVRREIFILHAKWLEGECELFSETVYQNTLARLQSLYQNLGIVSNQQLNELILLVEDILAVVEKNQKIYVDLNILRNHDNYTYVHCVNVAILASLIGKQMGFDTRTLRQLVLGALLHDLGKVKIPSDILNKAAALSEDEFALIKLHPTLGYDMLKEIIVPWEVSVCLLQHHERWQGCGYPRGLREDAIHLNAQITAVADVFDAVAADRPYRCGLPPYHAIELILNGQNNDFSPVVVQAFAASVIIYPQNSTVTLNTGEVGVVVGAHPQCPTRPKVRLLFDKAGQSVKDLKIVDLLKELTMFIVTVEYNK